jgi:hypothetical protein
MSVSKAWQEVAQAVLEGSRVALENRQYNRLVPRYAEMGLSENELRDCLRWAYLEYCKSEINEKRRNGEPVGRGFGTTPTKPVQAVSEQNEVSVTESEGGVEVSSKGRSISNLEQLVEAAKIDLSKWVVLEWSANTWESFYRVGEKHRKVQMWQVKARLAPSVTSFVKPVESKPIAFAPPPPIYTDKPLVAVVVPDTQHGFRWNDLRTKLIPMHDRRAIDAVVQLIARVKPDLIVHLGDGPDFAEWSTKYVRGPELVETTQPAIEELHFDLRRMRKAAPKARFIYLEGNHCFRIRSALTERLPVALSAKAVGDNREALHLARLLGFDGLGIEYAGPYGSQGDDWYWEDRVRFVHDGGVRGKGGQTVASHVAKAEVTTLFGHIHRVELAARTIHRQGSQRVIVAASAGCLCRIDGAVPGATARPDWQQGCAVVYLTDRTESVQLVPINGGSLVWNGVEVVGQDYGHEVEAEFGRPVS